jgi:hypothetical protein
MHHHTCCTRIAVALTLLSLIARPADAAYIFTKISEVTTTTAHPAYGVATINDFDVVGFNYFPAIDAQTIYKGSGGPLTAIYSETASNITLTGAPINNHGVVAFRQGGSGSYNALKSGSGGAVTTMIESFSSFTGIIGSQRKFFNDAGQASYYTAYGPPGSFVQMRYNPDGTSTVILDHTSPLMQLPGGNSTINAGGVVAFHCRRDDNRTAIFTGDGTTLTSIAVGDGTLFSLVGTFPSINNSGLVAFQANAVDGGTGIYTADGTTTTQIADLSGPITTLRTDPSLPQQKRHRRFIRHLGRRRRRNLHRPRRRHRPGRRRGRHPLRFGHRDAKHPGHQQPRQHCVRLFAGRRPQGPGHRRRRDPRAGQRGDHPAAVRCAGPARP